jgi:putative flippase GtrA
MTRTLGQIARFGVVGLLATATHYLILAVGTDVYGQSPVLMTALAFCCAVLVTYAGQSLWVFRVRRHDVGQALRFGISVLAGLLGNVAIMYLVVERLGGRYQAGFLAGVILVPLLTFVLNRTWVFSAREDT